MRVPFGRPGHSSTPSFNIHFLSESAVTIEFGQEIDEMTFNRVHQLDELVNRLPFEGFIATVPAYTSLAIFYDTIQVVQAKQLYGLNSFERISNYLIELQQQAIPINEIKKEPIHLPICYEEELGPDLAYVASYHNISTQELIKLHSSTTYKVYMIGFVPGFAYLGGTPSLLETPRKKIPRKQVPAGSVGIAGKQTGIYPLESSGGWQIIGCTPLRLFDINRSSPSLLRAGDEVIFDTIDLREFKRLRRSNES